MVIRMEATKQQSTEHILMNQPRQQAQFHDSYCPLRVCFHLKLIALLGYQKGCWSIYDNEVLKIIVVR